MSGGRRWAKDADTRAHLDIKLPRLELLKYGSQSTREIPAVLKRPWCSVINKRSGGDPSFVNGDNGGIAPLAPVVA